MNVTMPDGTVIEGVPDGTTKAQLTAKYAAHVGGQNSEQSGGSTVSSLMAGIANGGTFNLMAPIAAGLGAVTGEGRSHAPSIGQRYQENLASYRAQDEATAAAHPAANIAGNIAGGFLNSATRALPVAKTLPGVIGQGVAIGAGYGAGTGVTNQDDAGQFAQDVGTGAALGGAIPAAIPALGAVTRGAGKVGAHVLGLTTGVGSKPIQGAFQAGLTGGEQGAAFASNMRGETPWADVVDQAKSALNKMRSDKNADYRSGMVDISKDPTVLDFAPIDKAMGDAAGIRAFKGQDISPKTGAIRQEIADTIDHWKSLDPAEYHTPEGFDALKQKIGDIRDETPFGTGQRAVANAAYSAVRKTIADQAPAYDKVMSSYSQASDAIEAIQKELSLGPKGNPGTAMRKLQSVMRDNVNTSYGNRATYADALKDAGAKTLTSSLAGQAMSSALPRGLGRVLGGAEIGAAILNPALLAKTGGLLAASSPRLVGEAAYGLGRGAGALPRLSARAIGRPGVLGGGIAGLLPSLPRLAN